MKRHDCHVAAGRCRSSIHTHRLGGATGSHTAGVIMQVVPQVDVEFLESAIKLAKRSSPSLGCHVKRVRASQLDIDQDIPM